MEIEPIQPFSKYLYLLREPKDVVVSYYFHMTKRVNEFEGNIDDFIDDPEIGMAKTCAFNEKWLTYFETQNDNKHLLVSYESLHEDAIKNMKKAIHHFGFKVIKDVEIKKAVEDNEFKRLKAKEKSGYYTQDQGIGSALSPVDNPEGAKVRKGKVGGHEEYMTKAQIKKCNEIFKNYPRYFALYKDTIS